MSTASARPARWMDQLVGRFSTMNAAITTLEISLETLENNEPINRREGNDEQADLEAKNAAETRQALHVLRAVVEAKEPMWPQPA